MKEEEKIKRYSVNDYLNLFYNIHLKEMVSAAINMQIFGALKPEEIVGEQPGPQVGQKQSIYRVNAKMALEKEQERFNKQKAVLEAIEEVVRTKILEDYE